MERKVLIAQNERYRTARGVFLVFFLLAIGGAVIFNELRLGILAIILLIMMEWSTMEIKINEFWLDYDGDRNV